MPEAPQGINQVNELLFPGIEIDEADQADFEDGHAALKEITASYDKKEQNLAKAISTQMHQDRCPFSDVVRNESANVRQAAEAVLPPRTFTIASQEQEGSLATLLRIRALTTDKTQLEIEKPGKFHLYAIHRANFQRTIDALNDPALADKVEQAMISEISRSGTQPINFFSAIEHLKKAAFTTVGAAIITNLKIDPSDYKDMKVLSESRQQGMRIRLGEPMSEISAAINHAVCFIGDEISILPAVYYRQFSRVISPEQLTEIAKNNTNLYMEAASIHMSDLMINMIKAIKVASNRAQVPKASARVIGLNEDSKMAMGYRGSILRSQNVGQNTKLGPYMGCPGRMLIARISQIMSSLIPKIAQRYLKNSQDFNAYAKELAKQQERAKATQS